MLDMGIEAFLLYFTDYACNSVTASLMYDYAMTGDIEGTATLKVRVQIPEGVISVKPMCARPWR